MATPNLAIVTVVASQNQKEVTINNGFAQIDNATNATFAVTFTSNAATLSGTQFTNAMVFVCPSNGASATLTVPLTKRAFYVDNTASANTVIVGGATGSTVTVPAGGVLPILCNGTNCRTTSAPAGVGTGTVTSVAAGTGLTGGTITTTGTISLDTAGNNTWTAAQRGAVVTLTDAATIATNMNLGNNFAVTLGGNRTLGNPTNITAGQAGQIVVTQDATGSRTLAYASDWKFAGGSAPTLSTAANAVDILSYYVVSSTVIAVSPGLNFS